MYGTGPFGLLSNPFRHRFAFLVVALGLGVFLGLMASTTFHFVPIFPLFWVLPFLAARAMGVGFARSRSLPAGVGSDRQRQERELLEALERRGWITATRAALETSLGVGEAAERLSGLAEKGHLRVSAHGGSLAYSLWDADLREIGDDEP